MKVYVVGYTAAYDGGDIAGVYSTRELAEASWQWRNKSNCSDWEITEFELDLDPDSEEPDIDRRPMYGPRTYFQYALSEKLKAISIPLGWP